MNSKLNGFFTGSTTDQCNYNNSTSTDCIMQEINNAKIKLDEYKSKIDEAAQLIFKEMFNADYLRGDIVVLTSKQLTAYNILHSQLSPCIMQQLRIDKTGVIKGPYVINGNYINTKTYGYKANVL